MSLITLNSYLAGAIALVALSSVACMNGTTSHAVRSAIVLLAVAAAGQAIGYAADQWDHYLDTLLYGAVIALMLATRRVPLCLPAYWSPLLAGASLVFTVTVALVYLSFE